MYLNDTEMFPRILILKKWIIVVLVGFSKRNRYHGADKVNRRSDVHGIIPFDADVEFFQNDLPTGSVSRINLAVRENKNKVVLMFNGVYQQEH